MVLFAKYLTLVLAAVVPFLLFLLLNYSAKYHDVKETTLRAFSWVVAVISGPLVLVFLVSSQKFHEIAWHRSQQGGVFTEEDMMELSDYPSVFATWVLFGWIPVLGGYFLAKKVLERSRDKTAM